VGAIELIRRGGTLMCGCSSKDLLMKVIAQGLSPESTTMDKVHSPLRVNTLDMDLNIFGTQSIQVIGLLDCVY
jgi:hypothetical protein